MKNYQAGAMPYARRVVRQGSLQIRWGVVIPFARRELRAVDKVRWAGAMPCARRAPR